MEFEKLKKHINNIEDYKDTLIDIEDYLNELDIFIPVDIEETFWNHITFLLQRIENNEQNSLEIPEDHGIEDHSFMLTDQLVEKTLIPKYNVEITEFERFLIALYFQGNADKKGGNHE